MGLLSTALAAAAQRPISKRTSLNRRAVFIYPPCFQIRWISRFTVHHHTSFQTGPHNRRWLGYIVSRLLHISNFMVKYMRTWFLILFAFTIPALSSLAQQTPSTQNQAKPEDTEVWKPVPEVVTPGATCGAAPSDAIILFDGKNLDQWVSAQDKSAAQWIVSDGVLTVNKKAGNIETKRSFKDYQLHLEWKIPESITGSRQLRGNSGLF